MTQEHTESTDRQDALNRLTDEGTDAIDPSRVMSLASRVTDGFGSGTLPLAGGGLLLYGAVKQLRRRRGRAVLQAIAGAGLLAFGLRRRRASEREDEWDPLEGDQGVSDPPGTADDGGDPIGSDADPGIDAGEIADEIGSTLSDRVPISDESASADEDESGTGAPLDADDQLDVHVTGAPGSGDPEYESTEKTDDGDRQDGPDAAPGDEGTETDDEESDDDQLGQDETDLESDTETENDAGTNVGDDAERESESDESIDEDELSEENEDKDEDIRGP